MCLRLPKLAQPGKFHQAELLGRPEASQLTGTTSLPYRGSNASGGAESSASASTSPGPINSNAQIFRNTGDEKAAAGDYGSAIMFYGEAIRQDPSDSELLLCRALAHRLSQPANYNAALSDANAAIQNDPANWNAWNVKGDIMTGLGDLDGAEEAFQNALGFASGMDRLRVQGSLGDVRARRAAGAQVSSQPTITTPAPTIPAPAPTPIASQIPPTSNPFQRNSTVTSARSNPLNSAPPAATSTSTPPKAKSPPQAKPQPKPQSKPQPKPTPSVSISSAPGNSSSTFTTPSASASNVRRNSRLSPTSPSTTGTSTGPAAAPAQIRPPPSPSLGTRTAGATAQARKTSNV
jgi:hypothetical protein